MTRITITAIALAIALSACGGGIDTIDERVPIAADGVTPIPPKPCPLDQTACHPQPSQPPGGQ